jgi:hypothetical protein
MAKVTHIIFRCALCGAYARVRVEQVGGAPLKDRQCQQCKRTGHVHIEEVDVVEHSRPRRILLQM